MYVIILDQNQALGNSHTTDINCVVCPVNELDVWAGLVFDLTEEQMESGLFFSQVRCFQIYTTIANDLN